MMTEVSGGVSGLTRRPVSHVKHQCLEENTIVKHGIDWTIFTADNLLKKEVFDLNRNNFAPVAFSPSQADKELALQV